MRHFVALVALLGLTACGGEMLPEESEAQAEPGTEQMSPGLCGGYKTQATCNAAPGCYWHYTVCKVAYE